MAKDNKKYDKLNIEKINLSLQAGMFNQRIIYEYIISSTNSLSKELACNGYPEGTVVIAEAQTAGRGRLGRAWESPSGKGIWMSFILRPDIMASEAPFITIITALSCAKALERVIGISPGIKWPNDIIYNKLKVCGILTELGLDSKMSKINFIVLGIGINVNIDVSDFPDELKDKAVSLKNIVGKKVNREAVIIEILNIFYDLYSAAVKSSFNNDFRKELIGEYTKYSITIGQAIKVMGADGEKEREAVGITNEGELIVINSHGVEERINSGEVSIRGINGYI